MAVPGSGAISLLGIKREVTDGNYSGSGSHSDISLRATSSTAGLSTPDQFSDFYGYTSISDIPTTNYAQNNGTSNAAFVRDAHTSGIVYLSTTLEVRMRRADPYVYLEIRERSANYDFARWYNTSNTANTLSTTYVPLARWNLSGITAIKMNWTGPTGSGFGSCYLAGETNGPSATYNAQDDTFQTVSNNQSIAFAFSTNTSAECYGSNVRNCSFTLTATARKSGYNDTTMGTYKIAGRSTATSNNCF